MSVKLSNSLEPIKKRLNINTLTKILNSTPDSYLKFVVNKDSSIKIEEEIKDILKLIPKTDIYLMPLGSTISELNENSDVALNMAIKNDFKYSDRTHIRIWDNKRGV